METTYNGYQVSIVAIVFRLLWALFFFVLGALLGAHAIEILGVTQRIASAEALVCVVTLGMTCASLIIGWTLLCWPAQISSWWVVVHCTPWLKALLWMQGRRMFKARYAYVAAMLSILFFNLGWVIPVGAEPPLPTREQIAHIARTQVAIAKMQRGDILVMPNGVIAMVVAPPREVAENPMITPLDRRDAVFCVTGTSQGFTPIVWAKLGAQPVTRKDPRWQSLAALFAITECEQTEASAQAVLAVMTQG